MEAGDAVDVGVGVAAAVGVSAAGDPPTLPALGMRVMPIAAIATTTTAAAAIATFA
jgi:hypothetical protein